MHAVIPPVVGWANFDLWPSVGWMELLYMLENGIYSFDTLRKMLSYALIFSAPATSSAAVGRSSS